MHGRYRFYSALFGAVALSVGLYGEEPLKAETVEKEELVADLNGVRLRVEQLVETPVVQEPELVVDSGEVLGRADQLPFENFESETDPYLEGYIQALVDVHFYEHNVIVVVKDHKVYLTNLPKNDLIANSIVSFVSDIPGVESVEIREDITPEERTARLKYVEQPHVDGIWFPQSTVLFQPLVADPRQPTYSVAWRFGDHVVGKQAAAVSLGDDFPIFRWKDITRWHGDMQIGIEAAVWSVFSFSNIPKNDNGDVCELVNSDFYVAIPLTFAFDKWSFRVRGYHISSHLGDEFLVNHPKYIEKRVNPSFEAFDVFGSYQFSRNLRVYFGPGVIVHSDRSFKLKPLYAQYGAEVRLFGRKLYYHRLYGTLFFAAHFANWQQHHWDFDQTYKLGYEISKLQGIGRKMRLYIDYHQGFSYEGQFFNERTKYGELGFSWGF